MFQISSLRPLFVLVMALASVVPARLTAQDVPTDPDETPLGDVARNLRENNPPPQQVIDNDNLSDVMNHAESRHSSVLRFLMVGNQRSFQISAPDATCSLAFTANAKALLSDQYAQMDLPPSDVLKLTGPASIEGDALTISLFNGSDWHVSEVDVAFTLVRNNAAAAAITADTPPPAEGTAPRTFEIPQNNVESDTVRLEKKADHTVIYKMRAAAPPLSATTFSAPLNLEVVPGQEWHWAIIQAKGYPPQNRLAAADQTSADQVLGATPAAAHQETPFVQSSSAPVQP